MVLITEVDSSKRAGVQNDMADKLKTLEREVRCSSSPFSFVFSPVAYPAQTGI